MVCHKAGEQAAARVLLKIDYLVLMEVVLRPGSNATRKIKLLRGQHIKQDIQRQDSSGVLQGKLNQSAYVSVPFVVVGKKAYYGRWHTLNDFGLH